MGKGDKKSKKGKRFSHSYGKTRLRKKHKKMIIVKKVEEKEKQTDQKKFSKPEAHFEKTIITETKAIELEIKTPTITEIKQEEKPSEVKEIPVSEVIAIKEEPIKETEHFAEVEDKVVIKEEAPVPLETKKQKQVAEKEKIVTKEEAQKPAPKKRGRPKKKSE